jgi:predicted oxidoreductase
MNTYELPGTEWTVSRLAYGCGAIGGTWDTTPLDDGWRAKAFAILDTALEVGINFFDHADVYTFGKSERVFGEYLAANPGLRDAIYIQSKCGLRFENTPARGEPSRYDFSYEHITASVDGILKRLRIDYLDSLLLHRPDPLAEPEEVARAFDALETAGKVRKFGVSNHTALQMAMLRRCVKQPLVIAQLEMSLAQPALVAEGVYANQDRGQPGALATGLLDDCRLHDMQVQAWSPLGGGGFYKTRTAGEAHPKQALIDAVQAVADARGCSAQAVMLAWLLRHPAKVQPILGTLTPERLREAVKADDIKLSRSEWYRLFNAALGRNVP